METFIEMITDFVKSIFSKFGNRKKVKLSIIRIDMFRLNSKFEYQVNAIIENHSNLPISITNMYTIFNKNNFGALLTESIIAEKKQEIRKYNFTTSLNSYKTITIILHFI